MKIMKKTGEQQIPGFSSPPEDKWSDFKIAISSNDIMAQDPGFQSRRPWNIFVFSVGGNSSSGVEAVTMVAGGLYSGSGSGGG